MTLDTTESRENEVLLSRSRSKDDLERKFYPVRQRGENPIDSGLTELNAAVAYDRGFFSHADWSGHVARYGHVLKRIIGLGTKTETLSLLDVGCGQLQLPYYAWRNRCPAVKEYWGLELRAQEKWLAEIGWKTPLNLVRMDICLDEPPQEMPRQFDLVVCLETFEHVPRSHAPALMQRLYNWTAPGGLCLFSTPNAGVARSTAENHHGTNGENREWDYDEKLEMQAAVGFELVASYGVFCGITRLPSEVWDNPVAKASREFHHNAFSVTFLAAAYPRESNNSFQVLRRR